MYQVSLRHKVICNALCKRGDEARVQRIIAWEQAPYIATSLKRSPEAHPAPRLIKKPKKSAPVSLMPPTVNPDSIRSAVNRLSAANQALMASFLQQRGLSAPQFSDSSNSELGQTTGKFELSTPVESSSAQNVVVQEPSLPNDYGVIGAPALEVEDTLEFVGENAFGFFDATTRFENDGTSYWDSLDSSFPEFE